MMHYASIQGEELDEFKDVFPYNFVDLSKGLRYLNFYLKTRIYKVEDWRWLLTKIEKKIGHWCNRWLSLGGRLIILKLVLESHSVYWLSMAIILASFLNQIRKVMFSFLWNGCSDKFHFHMCKWESLAKPKIFGGWGFQNIHLFNKALDESTLWCVLVKGVVWHSIVKDTYFPFCSEATWLRSVSFRTPAASDTLKNLLKTMHLITQWLSYNSGSRHFILIGKDQIQGPGISYFLFPDLLSSLQEKKLTLLYQAKGHS